MVNDIIEELLNLDMEPKPESLWWMSSYEEEDQVTLKVWEEEEGKIGTCLSGRSSRYWCIAFNVMGRAHKGSK